MSFLSPAWRVVTSSIDYLQSFLVSAGLPDSVSGPLAAAPPVYLAYRTLYYVSRAVWELYLRPVVRGGALTRYCEKDAWAVVTGCTDGIGKAFAVKLGQIGYNVLLLSRNQLKLDETKAAVEATGVKAEIAVIDFSSASSQDWTNVSNALQGKKVTVLLNNVGVSYDHAAYFHEVDQEHIDRILQVNVGATHRMTRLVLPIMQSRRTGFVINVSSGTSILPTGAYLASYAASKVYINSWTNAMNDEYGPHGIRFETLVPFLVSTNMSKVKKPSLAIPSAEAFVSAAAQALGCAQIHAGYRWHQIQMVLVDLMPQWFSYSMALKLHIGIREKAIQKKIREQKGTKAN